MPVIDHLHQYKRVRQGKDNKYIIYRCTLPNCSHFVPKDFFVGKEAQCPFCHKRFIIGTEEWHLKRAEPNCGCRTITKQRRDTAAKIEQESLTIDDILSAIVKEES